MLTLIKSNNRNKFYSLFHWQCLLLSTDWKQKQQVFLSQDYDYIFVKLLLLPNILNRNTYKFLCVTIIIILIEKKLFKKKRALHRLITSIRVK